jgi:hypothetical protein
MGSQHDFLLGWRKTTQLDVGEHVGYLNVSSTFIATNMEDSAV